MGMAVNNLQDKVEFNQKIKDALQRAVTQGLKEMKEEEREVSIALVDDDYIRNLNSEFRSKEEATDVLSFPQEDEYLLGDVIISLETASRQAEDYGHTLAREVGFLAVHGFLHLLGYNHKQKEERKIMRKKEEEILAKAGLER